MTSYPLVCLRWLWTFELLSMDVVEEFYKPMGFYIDHGVEFRSILRSTLTGKDNPSVHTFHDNSKEDVITFYETQIVPAVTDIAATLGQTTASRLRYWVEDIYMEDGNPWTTYETILGRCWDQYRNHGIDVLQLGSIADEIYGMLREYVELDDIEAQTEVLKASELSGWDKSMYEHKGVDGRIDWYPHFVTIKLCVSRNRLQLVWERIRLKLSDHQLETLTNLAAESGVRAQDLRRRLPIPNGTPSLSQS